jgi:hypothetical protein
MKKGFILAAMAICIAVVGMSFTSTRESKVVTEAKAAFNGFKASGNMEIMKCFSSNRDWPAGVPGTGTYYNQQDAIAAKNAFAAQMALSYIVVSSDLYQSQHGTNPPVLSWTFQVCYLTGR